MKVSDISSHLNTMKHYAITFDSGYTIADPEVGNIFIDGVKQSIVKSDNFNLGTTANGPVFIGKKNNTYFNGELKFLKVWNNVQYTDTFTINNNHSY